MGGWLAVASQQVRGSNLGCGLSVWNLHVLPVCGFSPTVQRHDQSKLTVGVNDSECLSMSDRLAIYPGYTLPLAL